MRNTRRILIVALPVAVIVGIVIALFLRTHGYLGAFAGSGGAAAGSAQAVAGGPEGSDATGGPGGASGGKKGRKAGPADGEDEAEDVAGKEPVWGVRITGLRQGEVAYALDVDGRWKADPKNPARSKQATMARNPFSGASQPAYPSLVRWPPADGQAPDSVRVVTPSSAEFLFTGKIREAVVYRSAEREGDWGTDELQPRNAAARANLTAAKADPMLGRVRGVVLNGDRQPVAGARVQVTWGRTIYSPSQPSRRTVVTGQDGAFEIDRLDLGAGSLQVRAAGYRMGHPRNVRIGRGEVAPVEIVLEKGVMVLGSVTNGRGQPVTGASVSARPAAGSSGARGEAMLPPAVVTNAAGLYTITSLAPGNYDLVASAEGYADATQRNVKMALGEAPPTVDLVLQEGLSLRGRVVRQQGGEDVGVAGVSVSAWFMPRVESLAARQDQTKRFAVTDAAGAFVLTGLSPGTDGNLSASLGLLQVSKPEPVSLTEGSAVPTVELRLPEAGRVAGRVVTAAGAPAAGAQVCVAAMTRGGGMRNVLLERDAMGPSFPLVTAGADGTFALENLPRSNRYVLEAQAPGYAPARSDVVTCDAPAETVLTLTQGGKIAGRVIEKASGKPLAHMGVTLSTVEGYTVTPVEGDPVATDASGAFSFDRLRPGAYQVAAQGAATGPDGVERWYFAVANDDAEVTAGGVQSVELSATAGGTLRGRVALQGKDEPVAGAWVTANLEGRRRAGTLDFSSMSNSPFWTGADGTFEIPDLMPGFYGVSAGKEGFLYAGSRPDNPIVRPGAVTDGIELRLGQGGTVRGLVTGPDGQPVGDAALGVLSQDDYAGVSSSGADGKFEFIGLDPNASPFRVATTTGAGPDGAWVGTSDEVRLTSDTLVAEVALHLALGGSIAGRVTDEAQQPIEGVRLQCYSPGGGRGSRNFGSGNEITTDAAGGYTVSGLTAGTYNIIHNKDGYQSESREGVVVAEGQPTAGVDLTLKKGRAVAGRVVDAAGKGLAGWNVSMMAADPGAGRRGGGSAQTDADGKFTIQSAVSGTVRFFVSMNRMARPGMNEMCNFQSGEIDLPEGDQAEPLTLTVDIGHTVKGRIVLSGSAKPVPGVEVMVNVNAGNAALQADGPQCAVQFAMLRARDKTGDDGAFTIENVPNGSLHFTLGTKGFAQKSQKGGELQGEAVLDVGDLEVEQARSLTGRLLDATTHEPYQPVHAYEEVTIQTSDDFGEGASGSMANPDEDGRFAEDNVADGVTRVTITAPGYLPLEVRDVKLRPSGPTDLGDLFLQPGCTLTGVLIDKAQGKPLSRIQSVQAEIQQAGKTQPRIESVEKAGDDGKFEIRGVAGDIESVRFRRDDFLPFQVTAIPAPDGQGRIDLGRIELESGGRIEGIVVDGQGAPRPGAQIQISPKMEKGGSGAGDEGGAAQRYPSSDGEGKFHAAGLPAGTYEVKAVLQGYAPTTVENIEVAASGDPTPVRIVVGAGAKLKGTLVDLGTRILSNWNVVAQSADGDGGGLYGGGTAQTGTLGDFELSGLPEGNFRLLFAFSQNAKNVRSSMGFRSAPLVATGEEVVFILPLGPMVKGRLVDEQGRGVAGARVHVSQGNGGSGSGNNAAADKQETGCSLQSLDLAAESATDDTGHFRVGPVAVGTAQIEFTGDMLLQKTLDNVVIGVDDERDLGDVTAQTGGVLTGRFMDKATGAPARLADDPGVAEAQAHGPDGSAPVAVKAKAGDSTFRATGVPAGATSMIFHVSRYLPCEVANLQVKPGQETDLGDVTVDPGVTLRVRLLDADTGAPYAGEGDGGSGSAFVDAFGQKKSGGDSWNSGAGPSQDRGVYLFRPAPGDLQGVTLTPAGCEPLAIDSVPSADSKGVVDLGDRKVTRKAAGAGQ